LSSREQILRLAYDARFDALSTYMSVTSLLRKCLTICQMLGRDVEWIKLELYGYGKSKTSEELKKLVPSYRRVRLLFKTFMVNEFS